MADEQVPPNTAAQRAAHKAAELAWEEERTWPIWEVVLVHSHGADVLWRARAGVNLATEDTDLVLRVGDDVVHTGKYKVDDPMPWLAPGACNVRVRAKTADQARALALRDNPEYDQVASCAQLEEEEG